MSKRIESEMLPQRIVLIACGSFSPPTPMHLRMFEIARDHFEMLGSYSVIGGILSPTHDSYGKKGLAIGTHRFTMAKLALQTSNWIRASDWELEQNQWSRTQQVLQYHQNYMNNYINSPNSENEPIIPGWLPHDLKARRDKVKLKLLCGADLLESFAVPGLWAVEDIEDIVSNHGLVVISRSGANPEKFIFDSDILTKYQNNITLITNWVPNEVSSTMIRRLLARGQSVKYLIDELVLEYIKINGLFNYKSYKKKSNYSIWKTWTDVNEIEMKAFLGVVINMGLIEVPELQHYWSQAFHSNIPFFGRIFSRRRFMQIFWTLHLETIPKKNQGPITRTQKVNNFLMYIESKCRKHFVPDKYLSIDESTVGFKGRISFLAYNPKKPTKWGLRVYVLADSQTSYIYSFVPYYGKITTGG